jgi:hypothetical protein
MRNCGKKGISVIEFKEPSNNFLEVLKKPGILSLPTSPLYGWKIYSYFWTTVGK